MYVTRLDGQRKSLWTEISNFAFSFAKKGLQVIFRLGTKEVSDFNTFVATLSDYMNIWVEKRPFHK